MVDFRIDGKAVISRVRVAPSIVVDLSTTKSAAISFSHSNLLNGLNTTEPNWHIGSEWGYLGFQQSEIVGVWPTVGFETFTRPNKTNRRTERVSTHKVSQSPNGNALSRRLIIISVVCSAECCGPFYASTTRNRETENNEIIEEWTDDGSEGGVTEFVPAARLDRRTLKGVVMKSSYKMSFRQRRALAQFPEKFSQSLFQNGSVTVAPPPPLWPPVTGCARPVTLGRRFRLHFQTFSFRSFSTVASGEKWVQWLFVRSNMSRNDGNGKKSTTVVVQRQQPNDSGQNSMEYWDYSVEIECLKGPQGLISSYCCCFVFFCWHVDTDRDLWKEEKKIDSVRFCCCRLGCFCRCGSGGWTWKDLAGTQSWTGIDRTSATSRHWRPNSRNGGIFIYFHQFSIHLALHSFWQTPTRYFDNVTNPMQLFSV